MGARSAYGRKANDRRLLSNGFSLNDQVTTSGSLPNLGAAAEVTIDYVATSAEQATGGVRINFILTDANRHFLRECDLANPVAIGECAAMANPAFGTPVPGRIRDLELRNGWSKRSFNWEFSTGGPALRGWRRPSCDSRSPCVE